MSQPELDIKKINEILESQRIEISQLEDKVAKAVQQQKNRLKSFNDKYEHSLTKVDKFTDHLARFAGSWMFIGIFASVLISWIVLNSLVITKGIRFDPPPFILLNLILSCIAAIQAPVIIMSQNRTEARDRARAEHDYYVNLKAELEVRVLHEKVDYLLTKQWESLIEVQKLQIRMLDEIKNRK